jgi:predicted transcriptional regulator
MTTITLTLPDDLAATLSALPEDQRNNYAVALMRQGLAVEAMEQEYEPDEAEKAEIVSALLESIEEEKAGRVLTLEEMDAALERHIAEKAAKAGHAGR